MNYTDNIGRYFFGEEINMLFMPNILLTKSLAIIE